MPSSCKRNSKTARRLLKKYVDPPPMKLLRIATARRLLSWDPGPQQRTHRRADVITTFGYSPRVQRNHREGRLWERGRTNRPEAAGSGRPTT